MPPRNDWKIEEFDRLQVATLEMLRRKTEENGQEIAIIKVKIAIVAGLVGGLGGICGSILTALAIHWMKLK